MTWTRMIFFFVFFVCSNCSKEFVKQMELIVLTERGVLKRATIVDVAGEEIKIHYVEHLSQFWDEWISKYSNRIVEDDELGLERKSALPLLTLQLLIMLFSGYLIMTPVLVFVKDFHGSVSAVQAAASFSLSTIQAGYSLTVSIVNAILYCLELLVSLPFGFVGAIQTFSTKIGLLFGYIGYAVEIFSTNIGLLFGYIVYAVEILGSLAIIFGFIYLASVCWTQYKMFLSQYNPFERRPYINGRLLRREYQNGGNDVDNERVINNIINDDLHDYERDIRNNQAVNGGNDVDNERVNDNIINDDNEHDIHNNQAVDEIPEHKLCTICQGEETNRALIPCGHTIGSGCLARWPRNCPHCRRRIDGSHVFFMS